RLGLNALLPDDIVIAKIKEVGPSFHSRFDAKSKVYRYIILNRSYPSAMLRNKAYFYPYPLDTRLMQQEAGVLLGRHNFKSFQARDKKERDPVKTIKKIRVSRNKDFIYVDIEADGFLYNMVRNIAGTLVEIGRGKISRGSLKKILLSRDRRIAGPTLPACGLYLVKVKY
ncbi:MAG: tRNA pseudouridine synthase A, partial [Candidatus Omnitrophica bacterium]|nr:tRNA pseudouridine synthase A [Candidatus Omnitrophota bacterium]